MFFNSFFYISHYYTISRICFYLFKNKMYTYHIFRNSDLKKFNQSCIKKSMTKYGVEFYIFFEFLLNLSFYIFFNEFNSQFMIFIDKQSGEMKYFHVFLKSFLLAIHILVTEKKFYKCKFLIRFRNSLNDFLNIKKLI